MTRIGDRTLFERIPGGGYAYTLVDEAVRVELRYLRRDRHQLVAEVDVLCDWAGVPSYEGSISCADLNLSSQSARMARAKYCQTRARTTDEDFDWIGTLDTACRRVILAERDTTPILLLDDAVASSDSTHEIAGLHVPADSHSQLIADGGGLKSLLLLWILGTLAQRGLPVLYLDWEWTAARHAARKRRLFGLERLSTLYYLRCHGSLVETQDAIRRACDMHHIAFLGLDSIGAACDGPLAEDETARSYNRVLTSLPPSLAAAHVPKTPLTPPSDLKAFGSAFFHNFSRMSWNVVKSEGFAEDQLQVLLKPTKQNDGHRQPPVALEITFSDQAIHIEPVRLDRTDFGRELPLHARLLQALASGPKTYATLADELGAKVDSIARAATRDTRIGKVTDPVDRILRLVLTRASEP